MSKKKNKTDDSIMEPMDGIEIVDGGSELSESKPTPSKPASMSDFLQAFRIYKKKNKKSELWDLESVKVFAAKRLGKTASLPDWFKVFDQY